jgi:superfamily II DNA/RNA helicase
VTTTFADLGVPASVCRALSAQGITAPFPIQAATLPDALAGRDLCGRAPTGSGKTIAFGIPLVTRIGRAEPKRPRALVLVPTRELAAQVREELVMLAGPQGARVEAFYGGNGFERQLKGLRRGVDIAVGCPGRLADLIGRGDLRLDAVEVVVIDEADRMADMGFLPEVRRLLDRVPDDRQTLLFSATLDGAVDELIRRYQTRPARHELAADPRDGAKVEHLFWTVPRDERIGLCAKVITSLGPTIVFCRTKRGADRVARQLEAAGVRAAAIHGDRSQGQRERALASFQNGQVDALVATDVAARGIHVDDVAGVVHLDPPADEKDYIHRSGRTGRAGSRGTVVSFVALEQRRDVAKMQRALGMPTGTTGPDATCLPQGEAPPVRRSRPTRPTSTGTPRPRRPRPNSARGAAKPGGRTRKPGSRPATKSGSKPAAKSRSKAGPRSGAKSTSKLNRKARRAHLQPGAATPTRASKGHRRQPSGTRAG